MLLTKIRSQRKVVIKLKMVYLNKGFSLHFCLHLILIVVPIALTYGASLFAKFSFLLLVLVSLAITTFALMQFSGFHYVKAS